MRTGQRRSGSRTSSWSDEGNGCVAVEFVSTETGLDTAYVEIKHSKISDSPVITFTAEQWLRWLDEVRSDQSGATNNGAVTVVVGPDTWTVSAVDGRTKLVFNEEEWTAFKRGVHGGEFDPSIAFHAWAS